MISTSHPLSLPGRNKLKQICKAISVLDAILSPDWLDRYYTYNSKWAPNEEFCGMRNGSGDELLILFTFEGCVINGMAHEYYPKEKDKITKGLPTIFHEFIFGEPVHSTGTTFCLWKDNNETWKIGDVSDFNDGSEELLKIFDGNPQTYVNWAEEYYEDGFIINGNTLKTVNSIYEGNTLSRDMVLSIVPDIADWEQLKADLQEINYPHAIDK